MLLRQLQHCVGHAGRHVPHYILFAGKVAGDAAHAQRLDALHVRHDRRRALGRVTRQRLRLKIRPVFTSA